MAFFPEDDDVSVGALDFEPASGGDLIAVPASGQASAATSASASGQASPSPGPAPGEKRGRPHARAASERSDRRFKPEPGEDARAESPGSGGSRDQRSLAGSARSSGTGTVVKIFKYCYNDVGDLRCKMCDIGCTDPSPAAVYDPPRFEGITPWRTYANVKSQQNDDGSLTVFKKPEGKVCALCGSVFLSLGWQDTHGSLVTYCKKVRDEAIHAKFIIARKKVIQTRLDHAASGQTLTDSPHRASKRARVHDRSEMRAMGAKVESFSGSGSRFNRPQRAFVEVEHWDEALDGKLDPALIVKQQIDGVDKQGIWRQQGRAGVHVQERFDEFGYRETHEEADDEGPLGAERLQNRRDLLDRAMGAQRAAEVERTAEAPFQGLDALALIRSLGVVKGAAPASGQEQRPNDVSSESSGMEEDDAPQAVSYFQALVGASVPAPTPPHNKSTSKTPVGIPKSAGPKSISSAPSVATRTHGASAGSAQLVRPPAKVPASVVSHEPEIVDGRVKRRLKTLQDSFQSSMENLTKVLDYLASPPEDVAGHLSGAESFAHPRVNLRSSLAQQHRELRSCAKSVNADLERCQSSPGSSQPAFQSLLEQLHEASGRTSCLLELMNLICSSGNFSDHAYVEAYRAARLQRIQLPAGFHMKQLECSIAHLMSVDSIDKALQVARSDSVEVMAICDAGITLDSIREFVSITVQNLVLKRLNAVSPRANIASQTAGAAALALLDGILRIVDATEQQDSPEWLAGSAVIGYRGARCLFDVERSEFRVCL